ncbi:glycosyltransferase family 4 protein [Colwellia sp. 6M3]|uniref:glycosyltransferase family 4 protein n=1 Tax=Colwellia sp. 6M3 TaxID=2759849 RepID=UPI0015F5F7B8|nr:glycosyltransferase family 4 protein [Colwellia sp. 6M3]MBA6417381.1 glycosyltransferase family 4 protein [Colwellia sp. 6M3]
MKVLHVLSSLNVGGAERFGIDIANVQRRYQKLDVSILSMGDHGEPLEEEVIAQNILLTITSKLSVLRSTIKMMDVVHVHSLHCLLRVLIASFGVNTKIVFTHHNNQVNKSLKWYLIYKLASFRVDTMVFVVKMAETKFLATYPNFKGKSITIANGVLERKQDKTLSNKFRLGLVGRFVPLKAQHILIEAVSLLPDSLKKRISLTFFGTGDLLENNRKLAELKIPDVESTFNGFITDRDEIYTNIDCLIVTSETEGLSLAILEAIASGTPIIASNVGGNSELVQNGVNGYLYEYGDIQCLSKNIADIIAKNSEFEHFTKTNKEKFLVNYSLEQCATQYLDIYQKCC